jgi:glyoxylase-like metal-dependent hydrolase (beta-lactamase superfamily II)
LAIPALTAQNEELTMTRARASALAFALVLLMQAGSLAAQDWDAVQIRTVPLGNGIHVLFGQGGNLGLSVGEDGAFLVDDQFAPLTDKIIAAIRSITPEAVRFVLNTHWHGDHTGGNENMGQRGALIVAHENVRRRMNPEEFRDLIGRSQQAPPDALPAITFSEAANFHWNGENIRTFHVEHAHTDGDVIVHFTRANVFHMGDTFFNGSYPFVDMESGGNVNGVIAAADRVLELANAETRIIPGHGDVGGPAELRAYRSMLMTVRDRVRELIAQGRSEDEVVLAGVTSSFGTSWSGNAERFVRAAYQSLARR